MDRKEQTLTPEAIQRQLTQMLESPAFDASERLKEFLSFVVEETLGDRGDTLKGQTIATAVFGRGEDFDPSHDAIVRVEARKLRKALENYYLRDDAGDSIRISIPKGAYVPSFEHRVSSTTALTRYEEIQVIASDSARHLQQMVLSPQEIGRELEARFFSITMRITTTAGPTRRP